MSLNVLRLSSQIDAVQTNSIACTICSSFRHAVSPKIARRLTPMTKLNLPSRPYRRIATEEAFSPPEMLEIYKKILAKDSVDVGFKNLMGFYMSSPSERAQHIMRCLVDLDELRLQHMDEAGKER